MSEDKNKGGQEQEFTPPATQEELNQIISQRLSREREKFSDYEMLKAKAAEFDSLSESQKTVEQKHAERIAALEAQLEQAAFSATKAQIQARYSISDEDAELFLTAPDPEKLEAQAKALADRVSERRKKAPYVPAQTGYEGDPKFDPMREITRQIFNQE